MQIKHIRIIMLILAIIMMVLGLAWIAYAPTLTQAIYGITTLLLGLFNFVLWFGITR